MRSMLTLAAATLIAVSAQAQKPASDQDHSAHHPAGASAPPSSAPSAMQMQATMASMQEMRDRMRAAKTPEERQALMADHMKAMQDGMAMMGRMKEGQGGMGGMHGKHGIGGGGGMEGGHGAMGRRMEMMEVMMQMMVDREAARSAPAKPGS
jgi:uncharacterized membrane protein YgcG